jgi:hypothetical protein
VAADGAARTTRHKRFTQLDDIATASIPTKIHFEQPIKVEFIINPKAAKRIGVTINQTDGSYNHTIISRLTDLSVRVHFDCGSTAGTEKDFSLRSK